MANGEPVFQLRIELEDVDPPVWRRLLVPGDPSLRILHQIFQVAMGWKDRHLHQLTVDEEACYVADAEDAEEEDLFEDDVSIAEALHGHRRAVYDYDFGDGWTHQVVIEAEASVRGGLQHAVCLAGQQACPPEDVGGPPGYANFLAALSDREHEEHQEMVAWAGDSFDPAAFDLIGVNVALQHLY